jgi:hypothetical protein
VKSYRFTIKATVHFDRGDEVIMSMGRARLARNVVAVLPRADGGQVARAG